MHGEIDDPQELINLIVMASKSNIFFSHRIWFFFQSFQFSDDAVGKKHRDSAQLILTQLKKICIESEELLCMVNATDLLHYIIKFGMLDHYPNFQKHFQEFMAQNSPSGMNENDQVNKMAQIRKIIQDISAERVAKAKQLIEAYHKKSEA